MTLEFKNNNEISMGIELELQLINLQSFDLAMEAKDFLRRLMTHISLGDIKPEITQSMIEINSSIHSNYYSLINELSIIRDKISIEANKTHIGVCGGGTHPFQKWKQQRIFHTERFTNVSEQYGFLAQQFTVFGQHIHIGCPSGDDCLYLCHAFANYIPHFIALSASSPFNQGVDTAFDCSRLTVVSAFPLSGTPPWLMQWTEFEEYFHKLGNLGVVKSMKDFYWDIRPKPEFGTVEIRICDTPLSIKTATALGAFAQVLATYLLENRQQLSKDIYLTYLVNRFRATRYGLDAIIIDPVNNAKLSLADNILLICNQLMPYAIKLNCVEAIEHIVKIATKKTNDAYHLRQFFNDFESLPDVVRKQTEIWMN